MEEATQIMSGHSFKRITVASNIMLVSESCNIYIKVRFGIHPGQTCALRQSFVKQTNRTGIHSHCIEERISIEVVSSVLDFGYTLHAHGCLC